MKRVSFSVLLLSIAFLSFSFVKHPGRKHSSKAVSKSMDFPVAGMRSDIEGFWGDNRDGGRRLHKGIDIYARKGTPVVAISDGVIVDREKTKFGGNTLWLKPANQPWKAYYAHLDKQLVNEGQRVRKGQVIGTVGNSGNARHTPSHLHFGIKGGGKWVNPLPYVKHSPKVAAKVVKKKKAAVRKSTKHKRRR
jgi:murein DD-endopeptidase MepM/ murein hydrolase activator NlpD